MYRFEHNGYPQAFASFPTQQYYRLEDVLRKEFPQIPINLMYASTVEPKFTALLFQHIGLIIVITTTVGKLVGTLVDVSIDYATLVVNGKQHHIRMGEIVYFEIAEENKN